MRSLRGVPEVIVSANGPQFSSSEFRAFSISKEWSFQHSTSSPHYPQNNGAAERAVRTAKGNLKQDDSFLALLTYRSTLIPDLGVSPAELVMGRKLRASLPTLLSTLVPHAINYDQVRKGEHAFKQRQKQCYHHHHGTRPLSELHTGDPVLLKKDGEKEWKRPAEVVRQVAPRSYLLHLMEEN